MRCDSAEGDRSRRPFREWPASDQRREPEDIARWKPVAFGRGVALRADGGKVVAPHVREKTYVGEDGSAAHDQNVAGLDVAVRQMASLKVDQRLRETKS